MARKTKQETTKVAEVETPNAKGPTWRIGVFRNDTGKLVTVYVGKDLKTPQPYETKRVGDRAILLAREYSGMKYSEARQLLLKEAITAGIEERIECAGVVTEPTSEPQKTVVKAKAKRQAAAAKKAAPPKAAKKQSRK